MSLNKRSLTLIVLLGILFIGGCASLKSAGQKVSDGSKKSWQAVLKADDWVRKNLW